MRRIFILLVLALLAVDAAAQQYPERRQVRKGNRAYAKGNYQDAAGRYMRCLLYTSRRCTMRKALRNPPTTLPHLS